MKKLRGICNQLIVILIATFLFSCQSKNKNAPTSVMKYSEYTDLEKMNLKGEVIGLRDYDGRFYFFNEKGMIEKEYHDENVWAVYDYSTDNRLLNIFSGRSEGDLWLTVTNFEYDSGYTVTKTLFDYLDQSVIKLDKCENDINGFPVEESVYLEPDGNIASTKFFRNNLKLDSSYAYLKGDLSSKIIYADGRKGKYIEFDDSGGVDKEYSCDYIYDLDNKGNDFKRKSIFLSGQVDSVERLILYKGDDLTKYSAIYSSIFSNMLKKGSNRNSGNYSQDNINTSNHFQAQPQKKEK